MAKPSSNDLALEANTTATSMQFEDDVKWVQYAEEFDYLLVGFASGVIRVTKNNKTEFELIDPSIVKAKAEITCMKHRPLSKNYPITNVVICTYSNGFVKGWNYNFKQCTFTLEEKRRTNGIYYHKLLPKFVTVGDDKRIFVYDEDSKRQDRILASSGDDSVMNGHRASVTTACFHPKQTNELVTAGLDNNIFIWDTRQAHAVRYISDVKVTGNGIDFNPKRNEFVTCCWQKEKPLRVWDYGSGKEITVTDTHQYKDVPLSFGVFGTKSHLICGGGEPNIIRIIDMDNTALQNVSLISKIPTLPCGISLGTEIGTVVRKFAFGAGKKIYEVIYK